MKEKFETSSISTIDSNKFQRFLTHTKLTLRAVKFSGKKRNNVKVKGIPPYKWSTLAKNHKTQRKNIIGYFNKYLKPFLPDDIDVVDVTNDKDFLNTHIGTSLPFNVRGGTDFVLAGTSYIESKTLRSGVYSIIELKKKVEGKHMWQSILEMIVADLYVNKDIKVFGVLTDLNKFWNVFWISSIKEIIVVPLNNPTTALSVIGKMVKSSKPRISGMPPIDRMKFMDLYDDFDDPNDDIALLEDFYDEMEGNEVLKYKMRKAIYSLKDHPIFSSMLE